MNTIDIYEIYPELDLATRSHFELDLEKDYSFLLPCLAGPFLVVFKPDFFEESMFYKTIE